jgi:putative transposase
MRGIAVSYETIRDWSLTFEQTYANEIKRRAPRRGDKWHMDEMCLVMKGKKHWLWREVEQEGYELDISFDCLMESVAGNCNAGKVCLKFGISLF